MNKIEKQCNMCGQNFLPKTVDSVYCSKKCSDAAYRKKKQERKKEEELQAIIENIPEERLFISVPEAIAMFGVAKSTLYRLIRQKKIPAINLGTRLVRIDKAAIEEIFPVRQVALEAKKKQAPKLYSLEPEDCYTIGEISKKYGVSDSSVHKHIRKFSIPTRQIGKFVYAPKSEIDNLYRQ
ncbi:helix-turn-helix domain-containing protein [Proteiniphilum saccharofermentans]|uniref:helix-turn-helix domain-containing protein n=1 Tax=Proteiniphilum saccharofermentans TaxID=1642647 RepID=UPI0028A98C16|nr:helix-turn-helix domain-containing protein [Proteiniphilum saccharofermentans]